MSYGRNGGGRETADIKEGEGAYKSSVPKKVIKKMLPLLEMKATESSWTPQITFTQEAWILQGVPVRVVRTELYNIYPTDICRLLGYKGWRIILHSLESCK